MTVDEGTAYHEAGHVVARWALLNALPVTASIVREGNSLGRTRWRKPTSIRPGATLTDHMRCRIDAEVVCVLAGHEAEKKYAAKIGQALSDDGAAMDRFLAIAWGQSRGCAPDAFDAYVEWCELEARALVHDGGRWREIEAVAHELTILGSLTNSQMLRAICLCHLTPAQFERFLTARRRARKRRRRA